MNHVELKPDSVMTVEGVLYNDWIPPLKAYGPLRRCSIKVSDIVNLINSDIEVKLREDQIENLYLFVKSYNLYIKNMRLDKPMALRAEEILYKKIYGKAIAQELIDNKDNPFVDNENDDLDTVAEAINIQSNATVKTLIDPLKDYKSKNKTHKREHMYEIFDSVDNSNSIEKEIENADMISQYGEIDFDLN